MTKFQYLESVIWTKTWQLESEGFWFKPEMGWAGLLLTLIWLSQSQLRAIPKVSLTNAVLTASSPISTQSSPGTL